MKIDYIQHAECEGCPYEEAELVKEEIYSDGEKYFVCERIKKISRRYPPPIMILKGAQETGGWPLFFPSRIHKVFFGKEVGHYGAKKQDIHRINQNGQDLWRG